MKNLCGLCQLAMCDISTAGTTKELGGLFQDAYKAVLVESEEQLLHLSRYIHRNPYFKGVSLKESPRPSSYRNYLGF